MKRLVILCDGTWELPADGPRESNVLRLARAVAPAGRDGVPQVVLYHPGAEVVAGEMQPGPGIDREIQSVYRFLVLNHAPGDELFFFGFSRGAYVARSCIGMLRNAWLLERQHEALVPQAYHVYRTHWGPDAENARHFREPHARPVRVRFLGAWDTVGEGGIPSALFPGFDASRHRFHDTVLSRIVEHACHALAIDERRAGLPACPWRTRPGRTRTEQAWFSGDHRDVGGGQREAGLARVTLAWMAEQAERAGLGLGREALARALAPGAPEVVHGRSAALACATGSARRPIGRANPDETLHASAEQRYLRDPRYRPPNLREFLARDEQIRLPL